MKITEERCGSSPAKGEQLVKFSEVQWLLENLKQSYRLIQVQHWKSVRHMNGTICGIPYSPDTEYKVSAQIKRSRNPLKFYTGIHKTTRDIVLLD